MFTPGCRPWLKNVACLSSLLCKLLLQRNRKFDHISQSGWETLTRESSKLQISTCNDSGTLIVFNTAKLRRVTAGAEREPNANISQLRNLKCWKVTSFGSLLGTDQLLSVPRECTQVGKHYSIQWSFIYKCQQYQAFLLVILTLRNRLGLHKVD